MGVRANTAFLRLLVRGFLWDSQESGVPFADVLKTVARARLMETNRGKVLIGTGSGGTSVTYSLPPLGSMTAADLAEVCSELLDKVDAIKSATPSITDAALAIALLDACKPIRAMRPDFACGLRR